MIKSTIMDFYKKLTVKIELLNEKDELQEHGSGIICVHGGSYYVLTAYHCLNPKNSETPRPEDWKIRLETEGHEEIEQRRILGESKEKDIAVIEINCPNNEINENRVQLFDGTVSKEKYRFRGFPQFNHYQPHTFHVTENDDNWWVFDQLDISAGRTTGVDILAGASGSGIFFFRRNKYFIVGIAQHLQDIHGTLNEVYVAPISEFKSLLPTSAFTTFSADLLSDWEKGMDKELTDRQIEELKQDQIEWIDNIVRKLQVMYPEQYQQKLNTFLGYYVKGREFFIKQGESNSSFRDALSEMTEEFFNENQPDPKIYVDTASEAETKFNQLKEDLVAEMCEFIPEDSKTNRVSNSYARYRLTERLLVCTLEYIKREKV